MPTYIGGGPDYNANGDNVKKFPWKFSGLKRAAERALLVDSVNSSLATKTSDTSGKNVQGTYLIANAYMGPSNTYIATRRHGGKANIGWSDGHVSSMTPQEARDESKDSAGNPVLAVYVQNNTVKTSF